MKLAACFSALAVAVFSFVLADEPASTPAAQPAAVPSTSAPIVPAASSDSKPAAAPPTADKSRLVSVAATDALIKQMRGRGYKPVNRNGTLVFCRSEGEIGTHFERTRCSTIEDLKAAELTGKEYVNSVQQQGSAVPALKP